MIVRRLLVLVGASVLVSCGSDSPTTPPAPVPTPTPVSYSGTYTGPMTFTHGGVLNVTGRTTVTHSSGTVSLSNLTLSYLGTPVTTFGLGSASFDGTAFDGSIQYSSSGCGTMMSRYKGLFGINGSVAKMNLQVTLTPLTTTGNCGTSDVRGELTRQ